MFSIDFYTKWIMVIILLRTCLRMKKEFKIKILFNLINQGNLLALLLKHTQDCSVLSQQAEQLSIRYEGYTERNRTSKERGSRESKYPEFQVCFYCTEAPHHCCWVHLPSHRRGVHRGGGRTAVGHYKCLTF